MGFPNGVDATASNGLVPRLTNVKRVLAVSTYGASRKITLLAGDNGRNTIGTAIRPCLAPEATVRWLALHALNEVRGKRNRRRMELAVALDRARMSEDSWLSRRANVAARAAAGLGV